jgi:prepilin-type N-terminal cleavage/methylation domain-containing protein
MKHNHSNHGITLTEILVTVAIIAILLAVSIPAAKELSRSLEQSVGAGSVIDAALANARAIAIREQKYAGVRFQRDAQGNSYLIFIIHDPAATGIANGFRAVENKKPMALPEAVGVIADGTYTDAALTTAAGMNQANTFSVVFNASGKFVLHPVQVRNRDGKKDDTSTDRIFNTQPNVLAGRAQFIQDDYPADGYDAENSVSAFRIYDKRELQKNIANPWTNYLQSLTRDSVNPYTGELIKK